MQCTSCRIHSDDLREYSRAVHLGNFRKTIDTVYLCAACRVINAINPKFVMRRDDVENVNTATANIDGVAHSYPRNFSKLLHSGT